MELELLILANGSDVRDLIPTDDRIRLIHLEGSCDIGAKRNFGCAHAAGDIIAHWDDDDFSAPGRIADQVRRLEESGKSVTGYRTMRFTDGKNWWEYTGDPLYALGTSLCYRRAWQQQHPFLSMQVGEDNQFVTEAAAARQLATAHAGDLMYATIHAGNTSTRNMGSSFAAVSK